MNTETDVLKNIYLLSGAGGHAAWQMGILSKLLKKYPADAVYGISAGAVIACAISARLPMAYALDMAKKMRPWNVGRVLKEALLGLDELVIPLCVQATDGDKGERVIASSYSAENDEQILQVAYGSSRQTALMKPWGRDELVDGGVFDTIPLEAFKAESLEEIDKVRIIVVDASMRDYGKMHTGFLSGIRNQFRTWKLLLSQKSADDLTGIHTMGSPEVLEFRPLKKLGSRFWGGSSNAKKFYKQGLNEVSQWLVSQENQ